MQPTPSSELRTRLAGILWGDAKTGKTTWAMTLPGRKLLINFDPDGYTSVANRDDFDVMDFSHLAASDCIAHAKKSGTYIVKEEDAQKYDSVIVDSLTTLTATALHDAVARGIGKGAKFTPTIDAPGLAAYGARTNTVNDIVRGILRATSQTKKHCFFIAHSDDPTRDDNTGVILEQTIMLSAKVRQVAALNVSEIYHLDVNSRGERIVYLAPFGVKKPMGSRIFNTEALQKFRLNYTSNKPDEGQPDTLASIFAAWENNGRKKLTSLPS